MKKKPFITYDGKVINNPNELYDVLSSMDESVFSHHVKGPRNDFSVWLEYINYPEIADCIRDIFSKQETIDLIKDFKDVITIDDPMTKINKTQNIKQQRNKKAKASKKTRYNFSVTGITEFDDITNGGIPEGHIVLLSGNAGTGKTTFSMQWLYNGAGVYNEPGIYVALTEPITKTLKNISSFKFYQDVKDKKLVHLMDLRSTIRILDIKHQKIKDEDIYKILTVLKDIVIKTKAKRMVIDSITALCYVFQDKDMIRNFIFRLGNMLNVLNCTTFLTSEVHNEHYSVFGVEEFISDGIIIFKQIHKREDVIRTLQIAKMRGIHYKPDIYKFNITPKGISILTKIIPDLTFTSSKKIITSGVTGLDKMLNGGFYEGSSTLVSGAAGTGKSIMGLQFLYEGLKKKQPGLLISFEESEDQILRNTLNLGMDLKKFVDNGILNIVTMFPDQMQPEELILSIKNYIESKKIQRCVIDSLSALSLCYDQDTLSGVFKKLNIYLKSQMVVTIYTYAKDQLLGASDVNNILTTTDNIIILKYVEIDSEMRLMISVIKTRGTHHDKKLREYHITKKGITIKDTFKGVEGVFSGKTTKGVNKDIIKAFENLSKGDF